MRAGTVAAVVIVLVYVGFEGWAVSKARYRMEADYIYPRLVAAQVAAERCGPVPDMQRIGFEATLERSRARLVRTLSEEGGSGGEAPADSLRVAERVEELRRSGEAEATAMLAAEGCEGSGARRLLRRHEIYSRK